MFRFSAGIRTLPRFFPRFCIGLKIQIALLGILGVLLTGAICLVGLNLAAKSQLESDQSVNLRLHVLGLSANYLEAHKVATEFLRKHDEKLTRSTPAFWKPRSATSRRSRLQGLAWADDRPQTGSEDCA